MVANRAVAPAAKVVCREGDCEMVVTFTVARSAQFAGQVGGLERGATSIVAHLPTFGRRKGAPLMGIGIPLAFPSRFDGVKGGRLAVAESSMALHSNFSDAGARGSKDMGVTLTMAPSRAASWIADNDG